VPARSKPRTELYRQVLAVWPDDTFARESLVDLLRAQERWPQLVAERRAEAKALPDGPAARRALREAAWVLEVRLDDAAQAAQVYDEWLVRIPDDRAALEGQARTRAKLNDRNSEVAARAALAEGVGATLDAQYLHGRALERAALIDEAADVYRNVMSVEEAGRGRDRRGARIGRSRRDARRHRDARRVDRGARRQDHGSAARLRVGGG